MIVAQEREGVIGDGWQEEAERQHGRQKRLLSGHRSTLARIAEALRRQVTPDIEARVREVMGDVAE